MLRRFVIALAVLAASCAPDANVAQTAEAQTLGDPAEIVRPLYAPYLENRIPQPGDYNLQYSADLTALSERANSAWDASGNEGGLIEFDIFVDGQDFEISNLNVTTEAPPADGRAVVVAQFNNIGAAKTIYYDMVEEDGAWKADNVRSDSWNYRDMLNSALR